MIIHKYFQIKKLITWENYLILIVLLSICSCSKNKLKIISVPYKPKAELLLIKKLVYDGRDSVFIGNIRDMVVIKNRIYVSDRTNLKLHIFDDELNYIRSSKKGAGPKEFDMEQYLSKDGANLVAYEPGNNVLRYLDSNFSVKKLLRPPPNFITNLSVRPVFSKSRVLISAYNFMPRVQDGLSDITTALLFRRDGTVIANFCNFDDVYARNKTSAYFQSNLYSAVAAGFNNSYFVVQSASTYFHQFDQKGNYIRTLNYKPRFYKEPPNYTFSKLRKMSREEYNKDYLTQVTVFRNFLYDKKKHLLYLNYNSLKTSSMYSKSLIETFNYLLVINKNGECIFDEKIGGVLGDIENGYIFTIVKEFPLTIYKYSIILHEN